MVGENIIYVALHDWDHLWYRRQQLATKLSQENRVLYVEPPIPFGGRNMGSGGLRQIRERLYIYKLPRNILPASLRWVSDFFNTIRFRAALTKVVRSLKFCNPVLFLNLMSYSLPLIGCFGEKLVIYDCADDYAGYPNISYRAAQMIRAYEVQLMQRVDIVFMTTDTLRNKNKKWTQDIYVVPNAVELERYHDESLSTMPIPADVASIPRPRVGYMGSVKSGKFDVHLTGRLAREHPEWSLVLVGPVQQAGWGTQQADLEGLLALRNVHCFGEKPHEDLPSYLEAFDVCILPYVRNEYTQYVNPVKLYQYLASGKPTVTTDIPSVHRLVEVIDIAHDDTEFIRLVDEALDKDKSDPSFRYKRLQVAKQNSWDCRIQQIDQAIQCHLAKRRGSVLS